MSDALGTFPASHVLLAILAGGRIVLARESAAGESARPHRSPRHTSRCSVHCAHNGHTNGHMIYAEPAEQILGQAAADCADVLRLGPAKIGRQ